MSWLSQMWRNKSKRCTVLGFTTPRLNRWQEAFCEWNAERLRISLQESRDRFYRSWAALPKGHRGRSFKAHVLVQMELCQPFWGNTPMELQQAYAAHEPLQFMRLLSYDEPLLTSWPELGILEERADPLIVDFGCGLAQFSIAWACRLRNQGKPLQLFLADLPLLHMDFLRWLCQRWELPASIAACTPSCPIPDLPACDLCVATEIFEHVPDPMNYLLALAEAVKPGGFLLTNLADHTDHNEEFLHISPDLAQLRQYLTAEKWRMLRPNRLYQKPEP
ncbi:MAG: methyltransferase domain-containing protein [Nitrospirae bacterium]|nr:methyltransferase domain-containing protein [Nitrospirota bacterium]